jgi:hypothetical protein
MLTLLAVNLNSNFSNIVTQGNVTLSGAVGAASALGTLTVIADTITLGGSVITSGLQSYWGTTVALNGPRYQAGGDFTVYGPRTIGAWTVTMEVLDIEAIDGPGALVLTAGPAQFLLGPGFGGFYPFAFSGNIVLGTVVAPPPLTSSTATGTSYQTDGARFTQTGATVLGPPLVYYSGGGGLFTFEVIPDVGVLGASELDPIVDATGNGGHPTGASIKFPQPSSINGD